MSKARVLVAMSGGVDSSVASLILKDEGYEVIGATMKLWPKEYCGKEMPKSCCSLRDIGDAKRVCDILNIRHYVLNFEDVFRKDVIDYFTTEYLNGRTPNPCIICNERIKFGRFMKKAEELECDFISTGHYVRRERIKGFYRLREALDKSKDQSYVLFSLSSAQIRKSLFPIGNLTKSEVRLIAEGLGIGIHKKKDSQEICFVQDNDYSNFIKKYCSIKDKEGDIVHTKGRVLGRHSGFWNFTIGQRKGLGIAHKSPLYVIEIDPKKNLVVAGESSEVKKKKFLVKDLNWIKEVKEDRFKIDVKIRYMHKKAKAILKKIDEGKVEIEFKVAKEAITPGQAAVFYDGEYVVGGGWIERVLG